ncbi:adenylosuccinate synthetase [Chloroflexia bacterium SDU3-3]|nr:adenylosuccinate synthetase [Chloroflexia bacterium SDU3-3]
MGDVFLTVDLGFGDAGKGGIVDYLTRASGAHTVVRYNGGAQAAHRVVEGGREHVFSQFGSGTLAGAATHLSRFMLVEPLAMESEAAHLRRLGVAEPFDLTTIDAQALVITPFHRATNRLRELARGPGRHGSCGIGVGEAAADALAHAAHAVRMGDMHHPNALYAKLCFLRDLALAKLRTFEDRILPSAQAEAELELLHDPDWADWLLPAYRDFAARAQVVPGEHVRGLLARPGAVIFEGAQGVLLDEWRGFHPYTTWSTTTLANADALLAEAGHTGAVTRLGLTRGYATRHGAGPFVSEDAGLTAALPDARNGHGTWQGGFRAGWLDMVMLRYALDVVGPLDGLAVTCLDRLADLGELRVCQRYTCAGRDLERLAISPDPRDLAHQERLTMQLLACVPKHVALASADALIDHLERDLDIPVAITSYGSDATRKQQMQPFFQR